MVGVRPARPLLVVHVPLARGTGIAERAREPK